MRLMRPVQAAWRFIQRPRVVDVTLVLMFVVAAALGATATVASGGTVDFSVLLALSALPLLVRRNRPLLAAALVLVVDLTGVVTQVGPSGSLVTMIAFYSVGRYAGGRRAAVATAVAVVVYGGVLEVAARLNPAPDALGLWLMGLYAVAIPAALGQLVRVRAELRERGQREAADNAVRAERRRIARELHDVVSHHLSVINALVGGARATLPPGQEVTREALSGAEQSARQALSEMRQLLDVLRADDGGGSDAATGVGAARLPALVEEVRSAGLPASLVVAGEPVPLPTTVDHAVYRIVQEALTNTRKHAEGARASIRLVYDPAAIEVEVLDDGAAKHPAAAGFGLGGMAERVALCGGQLWTGPRLEGGFRVHARIPLEKT